MNSFDEKFARQPTIPKKKRTLADYIRVKMDLGDHLDQIFNSAKALYPVTSREVADEMIKAVGSRCSALMEGQKRIPLNEKT